MISNNIHRTNRFTGGWSLWSQRASARIPFFATFLTSNILRTISNVMLVLEDTVVDARSLIELLGAHVHASYSSPVPSRHPTGHNMRMAQAPALASSPTALLLHIGHALLVPACPGRARRTFELQAFLRAQECPSKRSPVSLVRLKVSPFLLVVSTRGRPKRCTVLITETMRTPRLRALT